MRHSHNLHLPPSIYPLLYKVTLPYQNIHPLNIYHSFPENVILPESIPPSQKRENTPLFYNYMRTSHNLPLLHRICTGVENSINCLSRCARALPVKTIFFGKSFGVAQAQKPIYATRGDDNWCIIYILTGNDNYHYQIRHYVVNHMLDLIENIRNYLVNERGYCLGGSHRCLKGGMFWEGGVDSGRVAYRCLKGGRFWEGGENSWRVA